MQMQIETQMVSGIVNVYARFVESLNSSAIHIRPATNLSSIYEEQLANISNYCLSAQEFEELYDNKSKFGVVLYFAALLLEEACKQIGMNEIRRCFQLQPQLINFVHSIDENPNANIVFIPNVLSYFKAKVFLNSKSFGLMI